MIDKSMVIIHMSYKETDKPDILIVKVGIQQNPMDINMKFMELYQKETCDYLMINKLDSLWQGDHHKFHM